MLRGHPQKDEKKSDKQENKKNPLPQSFALPQVKYPKIPRKQEEDLKKREYLLEHSLTNYEEDFELRRLKDPTTRAHAARITELFYKENKTPLEIKEYNLYEDESTRPYAARMIELELKQKKTDLDLRELAYLNDEVRRPYAYQFLKIHCKAPLLRSPEENKLFKLLSDERTMRHANEIVALEKLDNLTCDEQRSLSIAYLSKLANISMYSKFDFHKDYRSHVYNPALNCVVRDERLPTYNRDVARFRAIEDAFNLTAQKLVSVYLKQVTRSSSSQYTSLMNQTIFEKNVMANPNMQAAAIKLQETLAFVLQKIFFEKDIAFSEDNLDRIGLCLNKLIVNQKIKLTSSDYKKLQTVIEEALIKDAMVKTIVEVISPVAEAKRFV